MSEVTARESRVVVDNWVLQEVAELLVGHLGDPTATGLIVDPANDVTSEVAYDHLALRIGCLLQLIGDVVLHDRLICDERFADAWRPEGSLAFLEPSVLDVRGVAQPPYRAEMRSSLLDSLCLTSSLRQRRRDSELLWRREKRQSDSLFATIVAGTAGNLARSHVENAAYSPHPLRSQLLRVSSLFAHRQSAPRHLGVWLQGARNKVLRPNGSAGMGASFGLVLPPVVARVLGRAQNLDEVIPAALEVRAEIAPLRRWLGRLQHALEDGDVASTVRLQGELEEVLAAVVAGKSTGPRIELAPRPVSLLFLSAVLPLPKPISLALPIGVQSVIRQLVLENTGENGLRRLLASLGEPPHRVEQIVQAFAAWDWFTER